MEPQVWLAFSVTGILTIGFLVQLSAISRRRGELRQALTTVREYEFIPVDIECLAEATRQRLERHTPPMIQLGLKPLGDYRMKPPPVEVHNRFFLSPEGDILGDITALLGKGGLSFISVLPDGTCVHTSSAKNHRPDRTLEPADQLSMTYAHSLCVQDLYRLHRAALNELARKAETPPHFVSCRSNCGAVMVYDQRLFNRWRFRHGDFATQPPAPDFATLQS